MTVFITRVTWISLCIIFWIIQLQLSTKQVFNKLQNTFPVSFVTHFKRSVTPTCCNQNGAKQQICSCWDQLFRPSFQALTVKGFSCFWYQCEGNDLDFPTLLFAEAISNSEHYDEPLKIAHRKAVFCIGAQRRNVKKFRNVEIWRHRGVISLRSTFYVTCYAYGARLLKHPIEPKWWNFWRQPKKRPRVTQCENPVSCLGSVRYWGSFFEPVLWHTKRLTFYWSQKNSWREAAVFKHNEDSPYIIGKQERSHKIRSQQTIAWRVSLLSVWSQVRIPYQDKVENHLSFKASQQDSWVEKIRKFSWAFDIENVDLNVKLSVARLDLSTSLEVFLPFRWFEVKSQTGFTQTRSNHLKASGAEIIDRCWWVRKKQTVFGFLGQFVLLLDQQETRQRKLSKLHSSTFRGQKFWALVFEKNKIAQKVRSRHYQLGWRWGEVGQFGEVSQAQAQIERAQTDEVLTHHWPVCWLREWVWKSVTPVCTVSGDHGYVVRSPFGAKHLVVVRYT